MHYNVSVRDSNNLLGALAQLVARNVRNVEVRGSTPLCSTKKSLLEPLSKSKALGEDFFIYFSSPVDGVFA